MGLVARTEAELKRHALREQKAPLVRVLVAAQPTAEMAALADVVVADPGGRIAGRYAAPPGAAYLARPDLHVCARWLAPGAAQVNQALATACGRVA